jgi:GT2 family glycosyltransferase
MKGRAMANRKFVKELAEGSGAVSHGAAAPDVDLQEEPIRDLRQKVEKQSDHIEGLEESIKEQKAAFLAERERTIEEFVRNQEALQAALEEKTNLATRLEWELRIKEAELARIHNSQGWKVLSLYYRLRGSVLPHMSKRREVCIKVLRACIFWRAGSTYGGDRHSTGRSGGVKSVGESPGAQSGSSAATDPSGVEAVRHLRFPAAVNPVVSIVIPAYNNWRHTYHCLESLLTRTAGVDYEVIISDDGSTDETAQMLEKVDGIKVTADGRNRGFVEACNRGARSAQGKYVVFLNNDTECTEGWLRAMVALPERDETIGVVGAKLVYPDGRLQEAGGIIWNDPENQAWNFGRFDDPEKWEYNYVKEVDYCSGACLLVRRSLLEQVGYFDTRYTPACYEDTDLAFAIRRLGYKVVYQPQAKIIHFEGASAGTHTTAGLKQFQMVNRKTFSDKWRDVIEESHYKDTSRLFLARDRSQKKKIMLFVDHYVPTWDKDAGSFITIEYLKIFVDLSFKIIFWPDNLHRWEPYISVLQQMGIEVIYGPNSFKRYVRDVGRYIDIACISRPHIAINYIDDLRKYSRARVIYIPHDLNFLREERRAEVEKNEQVLKEAEKWRTKEFYLMGKSDTTIVFSPVEAAVVKEADPGIDVRVTPWVQPLHGSKNGFGQRKNIIFIGGFGHPPNEDALLWFAREVFPFVKNEIRDIKFIVMGSNPTPKVRELQSNEIEVTGYVPDISGYFDNARVFVAPLRYGAGLKGKVLQAMSYGLPVVTTPVGAEGIPLTDGENVLIAKDAADFARKTVSAYVDQALWEKLSHGALRFVEEKVSVDNAEAFFKSLFGMKIT